MEDGHFLLDPSFCIPVGCFPVCPVIHCKEEFSRLVRFFFFFSFFFVMVAGVKVFRGHVLILFLLSTGQTPIISPLALFLFWQSLMGPREPTPFICPRLMPMQKI